jgi:hypothetical protein
VSPYERVVAALKAHGSRPSGKNWQCPAHQDRTPSLSVSAKMHPATGEPIVLMHCHAGCSVVEVLGTLGLEPSDLFTGNGQGRLFPIAKFSPVGLDIWLKMPPNAQRDYAVATTLGRYLPVNGGRAHVYSQRQIAAVILEPKHRRAVRETLEKSAQHLSNLMTDWESWGVAHRCSRAAWTLYVRQGDACPACRSTPAGELEAQESTPTGELQSSPTTPTGELPRHEDVLTDDGFFKGLAREPGERWEVYPELQALEYLNKSPRRRAADG